MCALFAAVQRRRALRTSALEIDVFRQRDCAVPAAARCYRLYHPRQPRTGHVEGRTRSFGLSLLIPRPALAVRVHIAVLSVFAVAVHGRLQASFRNTKADHQGYSDPAGIHRSAARSIASVNESPGRDLELFDARQILICRTHVLELYRVKRNSGRNGSSESVPSGRADPLPTYHRNKMDANCFFANGMSECP